MKAKRAGASAPESSREGDGAGQPGQSALAGETIAGRVYVAVVDEEIFARLLVRLLTAFGFCATAFSSAEALLNVCRSEPSRFDWVVTDSHLPDTTGATGLELLTRLREYSIDCHVRGIVISGMYPRDAQDWEQRVRSSGAEFFLHKPFDIQELVAALRCPHPHVLSRENLKSTVGSPIYR
jgi:CheY-like chemotaxis protein